MAFIGVLVGASFASGREALQYFVAFGNWGVLGAILTSLAMMVSGVTILQLGSYHRAKEHTSVFVAISGPVTARILDVATMITLFCIGFAMFAGAGANLEQQFGWSVWIGAVIMLALVLATGLLDVGKVTFVIGAITPFIIVLIAIATLWTIFTAQPDFATLHEQAQEVPTTLPNWWVAAINNLGLNVIVVVSMAIVIGGNFLDSREVGIGGIVGGFVFLFLLAVLVGSMYLTVDVVLDSEMPTLAMITDIHPSLGVFMALAIYGMIYNTAIGMFYALAKRLTVNRPEKFRLVFVAVTLAGFVVSFLGFSNLLGWVYPVIGYVGMVMIAAMVVAWFKGQRLLKKEEKVRDRLTDLAEEKLDPATGDLSDGQVEEVKQLAKESRVDGKELWVSIQKDVASDLELDDAEDADGTDQRPETGATRV